MVSAGGFQLPCSLKSLLTTSTASSLSFPSKTQLSHFAINPKKNPSSAVQLSAAVPQNGSFFCALRQFSRTHLAVSAVNGPRESGVRIFASKKQGGRGVELLDMEGFDDELLVSDYDEDEADDDDDVDGSMLLPLGKMKKWLENKPRGFGEGKVYDTSIEDNLLGEMEQSRTAQSANLSKLKNDPANLDSNQDKQKKKVNEVVPNGFRVRVVNLPKKKNVHRDLSSAFKGVPGMISINPVVSGNKKTRDPICKGFAFVKFKSKEDATRFIQMFSRKSISFGKIQKQIRCEMINSETSDSGLEQPVDDTYGAPQLEVHGLGEEQSSDSYTDDSSLEEWEKSASLKYDESDDELHLSEFEDISENLDSMTVPELSYSDSFEQSTESESIEDSVSSEIEPIWAIEKKLLAKGKQDKVPGKRLNVKDRGEKVPKKNPILKRKEVLPGSTKRLRVKERAVLTDVFSKYALKSGLPSKEES